MHSNTQEFCENLDYCFSKNIYIIKIHHFSSKEIFHAEVSVVTTV